MKEKQVFLNNGKPSDEVIFLLAQMDAVNAELAELIKRRDQIQLNFDLHLGLVGYRSGYVREQILDQAKRKQRWDSNSTKDYPIQDEEEIWLNVK